jgi:endogenous inhibitor of DNA gyrase (YacG/DUF329 family)
VRCPICKRKIESGSKFAPFCSERCKLIDLGRWLGEGYRIPGDPAPVPETREDDGDEDDR